MIHYIENGLYFEDQYFLFYFFLGGGGEEFMFLRIRFVYGLLTYYSMNFQVGLVIWNAVLPRLTLTRNQAFLFLRLQIEV